MKQIVIVITERQALIFQTSSGRNIFSKFYIMLSSHALLHTNANVRCERHHLLPQTPFLKTQTLRVNVTLLLFQGFHITFLGVFKPKIFYFSVFTPRSRPIKWLGKKCVKVFILHRDTDAIGYCSHLITSVSVSVCAGISTDRKER